MNSHRMPPDFEPPSLMHEASKVRIYTPGFKSGVALGAGLAFGATAAIGAISLATKAFNAGLALVGW